MRNQSSTNVAHDRNSNNNKNSKNNSNARHTVHHSEQQTKSTPTKSTTAAVQNYSKHIQMILCLISLSVVLLFLITEQMAKRKMFVFEEAIFLPAGDFVDMVVMTPIFFIGFWIIHSMMIFQQEQAGFSFRKMLHVLSCVGLTVFIYGTCMHTVGNAVHTVFTERRPFPIPKEHLSLMYFFDETLSHILMLGAWYGMIMVWVLAQNTDSHSFVIDGGVWRLFAVVNGVFTGVMHTMAFIEGDCPRLGIYVLCPLTILCVIVHHSVSSRRQWKLFSLASVHDSPISTYGFYMSLTVIAGECLYAAVFGDWIQPSEHGGMACMLLKVGCQQAILEGRDYSLGV